MEKRNIFARMKVGIIFGGASREREISFAAGRTVYDSLDKFLFEAVPVFADSLGNFILLEWQHLYQNGIRDFYPPAEAIPNTEHQFSIYIESLGKLTPEHQEAIINRVGRRLEPAAFSQYFDFAFLTLPGSSEERNNIISLLKDNNIPFAGSDIMPAANGLAKLKQNQVLAELDFPVVPYRKVSAADWAEESKRAELFWQLQQALGLPLEVWAADQSARSGDTFDSVITANNFEAFAATTEHVLFQRTIYRESWSGLSPEEQVAFIKILTDLPTGIGMPVSTGNGTIIHHPEQLLQVMQRLFTETDRDKLTLYGNVGVDGVIVASLPAGKAFQCLVMQETGGQPLALVPTLNNNNAALLIPEKKPQIKAFNQPFEPIQRIRQECQRLFSTMDLQVYAWLQGIVTEAGEIFFTHVDTAPALLPASIVFRQAAEIGINSSQLLTFIIRTSLSERWKATPTGENSGPLLPRLEAALNKQHAARYQKIKVGIVMEGNAGMGNESVASGRNIYRLLAASDKYQPVPILRIGPADQARHYLLPLAIMLLDKTEDIIEKITQGQSGLVKETLLDQVRGETENIRTAIAGPMLWEPQYINYEQLRNLVDLVFIALTGQEAAGEFQTELEKLKLPYTGSGLACLQLVKDKSGCNALLKEHGLSISELKPREGYSPDHTVTVGLLTRYLPDGRVAYEVFEAFELPKAGVISAAGNPFVTDSGCPGSPVRYAAEPQVNQLIAEKVKAVFLKAAQVLNIEGYAQLEALVNLVETDQVEIKIKEINLMPALAPNACIFRQAAASGYKPYHFLDRILQFSLERQKKKD